MEGPTRTLYIHLSSPMSPASKFQVHSHLIVHILFIGDLVDPSGIFRKRLLREVFYNGWNLPNCFALVWERCEKLFRFHLVTEIGAIKTLRSPHLSLCQHLLVYHLSQILNETSGQPLLPREIIPWSNKMPPVKSAP